MDDIKKVYNDLIIINLYAAAHSLKSHNSSFAEIWIQTMESGDNLGSSWYKLSRDRLENLQSLGNTNLYPRSPLI